MRTVGVDLVSQHSRSKSKKAFLCGLIENTRWLCWLSVHRQPASLWCSTKVPNQNWPTQNWPHLSSGWTFRALLFAAKAQPPWQPTIQQWHKGPGKTCVFFCVLQKLLYFSIIHSPRLLLTTSRTVTFSFSCRHLSSVTILALFTPGKSLAFFSPKYNCYLFGFGAVPFHIAIYANVPKIDNKPTGVQRSINNWTKPTGAG